MTSTTMKYSSVPPLRLPRSTSKRTMKILCNWHKGLNWLTLPAKANLWYPKSKKFNRSRNLLLKTRRKFHPFKKRLNIVWLSMTLSLNKSSEKWCQKSFLRSNLRFPLKPWKNQSSQKPLFLWRRTMSQP